jgi:phenylpropionate dioxygenase-like ring-hydroxylating dioxygenase large terminal subunit
MTAAIDVALTSETGADRPSPIVKECYFSPDYVRLEYERLWPRVWQMVCREEELPEKGDYLVYDIGPESLIIVRTGPDGLRAFHNVCQHRGRRLVESGQGNMANFPCKFHGWRWSLDGAIENVTQIDDWCGTLEGEDLSLPQVRLATWGGWVFVCFDAHAEPLTDYLGEAADILAPLKLEEMRYRWRRWLKMPCNWKVALEAFNEGYHVSVTHFPLNRFGKSVYSSRAVGRHGNFGIDRGPLSIRGTAHRAATTADMRRSLADFYRYLKTALDSNMTDTIVHAAQMLPSQVADDAPAAEVSATLNRLAVAIDAARGVEWPKMTPEQQASIGIDWHFFPNMIILPMATNCLGYRARPDGNDPDSCIFEVYQLERMPAGSQPRVEHLRNDDIRDDTFWPEILLQDFQQMEATHQGIKSSGYRGPRLNPKQEIPIENFHRVYHEFIDEPG